MMKTVFRRSLISLLAISAGLCTIACKENKPKTETELKVYLTSEPFSLDPRIGGDRRSQMLMRELFEGLTRIGTDGKPHLAAAEAVEISPDGKTYRFLLKKSFWSSGDPVTAHDFAHAWKCILDPNFPSGYSYALTFIQGASEAKAGKLSLDQVGIHAVNDHTLVVELVHPAAYFLELAANPLFSPVSKKADEKNSDWAKSGGSNYVCNGPFTLKEWKHQQQVILQKNPKYTHAEDVKLDIISAPIIEDPQTALNMFEKGDIDWVGEPFGNLPLEAIPELKKQNKLEMKRIGGLFWYQINIERPLLSNLKVRKALAMSLNRRELTQHLLQGGEVPAFSLLPEVISNLDAPPFNDYDLAQARVLFHEGLQELGMTEGNLPTLTLSHWQEPREKAIASAVQQQWQKALGLKINLASCDWSSFLQKFTTSDFDIAGLNWYCWYQDPIYNLESMKFKESYNGTNWEHPHFIALLNRADDEVNPQKRRALFKEAEELILEELPIIPVYEHTYKYAKKPSVSGEYLSPVGQLELKDVVITEE